MNIEGLLDKKAGHALRESGVLTLLQAAGEPTPRPEAAQRGENKERETHPVEKTSPFERLGALIRAMKEVEKELPKEKTPAPPRVTAPQLPPRPQRETRTFSRPSEFFD